MNLPILGISMGDPFGNGPEITVKALADRSVYDRCRPLVVGDMASMEYAVKVAEKVSGIHLELRPVRSVAEARFQYGTIDVYDMGLIKAGDIPCDAADPRPFGLGATALGGEASFQYVVKVIELAMAGEVDATITNALSKEAINMAGHHYSGHTEIYADYTHTSKYTMMLAHEDLRVVHVSTHVSLREACDRVKKDRVLDVIRIANAGCKAIGIKEPKIAVATSVLGALGCDMAVFLRYFPAAETMYSVFVALGIGIILLNWVWQLFKNFGLGAGIEAEDPLKLSIRSVIFILLAFFSNEIVSMILTIGGTPYNWIMDSELPALSFADFNSVMLVIIGVCANGAVALITLILVIILAWNYLKLLLEAAERYVLLGVLVYTAPLAFSMGASQTTSNIWKSWCRMLGGQIFLLLMNAWCMRLFTSMVGSFISNPLSL